MWMRMMFFPLLASPGVKSRDLVNNFNLWGGYSQFYEEVKKPQQSNLYCGPDKPNPTNIEKESKDICKIKQFSTSEARIKINYYWDPSTQEREMNMTWSFCIRALDGRGAMSLNQACMSFYLPSACPLPESIQLQPASSTKLNSSAAVVNFRCDPGMGATYMSRSHEADIWTPKSNRQTWTTTSITIQSLCVVGIWDAKNINCTRMCLLSVLSGPYVLLNETENRFVNESVKYSCQYGFMPTTPQIYTCTENGTWTNEQQKPTCIPVPCPALPTIPNGAFLLTNSTHNTTANFSCSFGYSLSGVSLPLSLCSMNGTWSPDPVSYVSSLNHSLPSCLPLPCIPLELPKFVKAPNAAQLGFTGGIVHFECQTTEQFTTRYLVGNTSTTCLPSGQWTQFDVACPELPCGTLSLPNGLIRVSQDGDKGVNAAFSCRSGYRLSRASAQSAICSNGRWNYINSIDSSISPPVCELATCTPIINILPSHVYAQRIIPNNTNINSNTNININSNTLTPGTIATIGCQNNYNQTAINITCLPDGSWAPTMQIKCQDDGINPGGTSSTGISDGGTGIISGSQNSGSSSSNSSFITSTAFIGIVLSGLMSILLGVGGWMISRMTKMKAFRNLDVNMFANSLQTHLHVFYYDFQSGEGANYVGVVKKFLSLCDARHLTFGKYGNAHVAGVLTKKELSLYMPHVARAVLHHIHLISPCCRVPCIQAPYRIPVEHFRDSLPDIVNTLHNICQRGEGETEEEEQEQQQQETPNEGHMSDDDTTPNPLIIAVDTAAGAGAGSGAGSAIEMTTPTTAHASPNPSPRTSLMPRSQTQPASDADVDDKPQVHAASSHHDAIEMDSIIPGVPSPSSPPSPALTPASARTAPSASSASASDKSKPTNSSSLAAAGVGAGAGLGAGAATGTVASIVAKHQRTPSRALPAKPTSASGSAAGSGST